MNDQKLIDAWNKSYRIGQNNILYPQVEFIKFINKYIVKRNINSCENLIKKNSKLIRGLDFGCGIGTQTITLNDFGIQGYGVDVSDAALEIATKNLKSKKLKTLIPQFKKISENNTSLEFEDDFFDFTFADASLDSMPFDEAKNYISDIIRVTKRYIYATLIGIDDYNKEAGEFKIKSLHEKGTIQSYFNRKKIFKLFNLPSKYFIDLYKLSYENCKSNTVNNTRYHIIIDLKKMKKN